MAINDNVNRPRITPVGDVPAATARAAAASPLSQPPTTAAPVRALPAPSNFIADAAGGVQRNTPSVNWTTAPGAAPAGPITNASSAQRLAAPPAPNFGLASGVQDANTISAPGPTRAAVVAPSPTGGSTLNLQPKPAAPNLALEPKALSIGPIDKPAAPAQAAAPVGEDVSGEFAKRTAAVRGGVDAGGQPRAFTPGQTNAVNESLQQARAKVTAAAPAAAEVAGAAAEPAASSASTLSKVAGGVGRAARVARRGVAYAPALITGAEAVNNLGQGQYGDAAVHGGQAGLDALAATAPTPLTIGAAFAGHATEAALNTRPGQRLVQGIANNALPGPDDGNGPQSPGLGGAGDLINNTLNSLLPTSPAKQADAALADMVAQHDDRVARGLPIPADYPQKLAAVTKQVADIRAGTGPDPAQTTLSDLITGGGSSGGGGSAQQLATPPAATAPAAGAPAGSGAPVQFMTPEQAASNLPPGRNADAAMASTTPGTAVINGRVLSSDEIANAGNRLNTVSKEAFTNAAPGVLFSEATGGGTPTSAQVARMSQSASAQRLFGTDANGNPVGTTGAGIGGPAGSDRQATLTKMMSDIGDAIRNGKRGKARALLAQFEAFDRSSNSDRAAAQTEESLAAGQQPRAQTDAQKAIDEAEAQGAQMTLAQQKRLQGIQEQLTTETDPAKRKTLQQDLLSLTGKSPESSASRLITLKTTRGTGLDAQTVEIPYDPATNKYQIPDGFLEMNGLLGSQPQAKPKK